MGGGGWTLGGGGSIAGQKGAHFPKKCSDSLGLPFCFRKIRAMSGELNSWKIIGEDPQSNVKCSSDSIQVTETTEGQSLLACYLSFLSTEGLLVFKISQKMGFWSRHMRLHPNTVLSHRLSSQSMQAVKSRWPHCRSSPVHPHPHPTLSQDGTAG